MVSSGYLFGTVNCFISANSSVKNSSSVDGSSLTFSPQEAFKKWSSNDEHESSSIRIGLVGVAVDIGWESGKSLLAPDLSEQNGIVDI